MAARDLEAHVPLRAHDLQSHATRHLAPGMGQRGEHLDLVGQGDGAAPRRGDGQECRGSTHVCAPSYPATSGDT
ncbi:MAG TPA: hypothetical protein VKF37_08590 [Chloroflexota bacterium]|nr:hypothetical protein [Chloroflexota bacterium]